MVADSALLERIRSAAASVADPELPGLTIHDLGILRDVRLDGDTVEVAITPTYSGCPAMHEIKEGVAAAVRDAGIRNVRVLLVLSPAWTSDWLTPIAREKLRDLGIAPPEAGVSGALLFGRIRVACPRCASMDTECISAFGATACKALHRCLACKEPFEAFKCH
jgi:ring-1,2-phenylacetyl-CoA epoxidase subunit PaaD